MRPRHTAPEVVPSDIEGGGNSYGKTISMAGSGGRPIIQPFEGHGGGDGKSKGRRGMAMDKELLQKVGLGVGGVWLLGWLLLGWDVMWPLYLVYDLLHYILCKPFLQSVSLLPKIRSFPPFSWFSWMFGGWMSRGAPVLNHGQPIEEATLPAGQVSQYVNSYVQQYGDAALIFATNDGYPQIVKELIHNEDLGYRDLVDARDDSGNTALIYAAAKGFRQCTAALLRAGADPELPNQGNGGRTPLMEAAGGGYKDIVSALRMMPKISVDLADDHGNTALHYAAYHGHLAVVMELLKSNPNKDLKNIYGHTAASYAASNKFKGIADVLNRADPARSQRRAQEKEKADEEAAKEIEDKIREHLNQLKSKQEHEEKSKHVKGKAENLHDRDAEVGALPVYAPTVASWRWPAPVIIGQAQAPQAPQAPQAQAPGPGRRSVAYVSEPVTARWAHGQGTAGTGTASPDPSPLVQPWPLPPAQQPPAQQPHQACLSEPSNVTNNLACDLSTKPAASPPEGVDTEAAIVDLKEQIGGLRKELHAVRSNLDAQLRKEQPQLGALRQRVNSLCSELADCGTEALKMCSDLGHRAAGDAVLRSRSAPGGNVWRRPSGCPQARNPAIRLSTGPAVYSCIPATLSPRMLRAAPNANASEPITSGVARRCSGRTDGSNLPSRAQSANSVNVMTANTTAQSLPRNESASSFVLTAKPMQVRTSALSTLAAPHAPPSPKETVPAKASRAWSPNPVPGSLTPEILRQASAKSAASDGTTCHNCGNRLPPDAPYCRFCGLGRYRARAPRHSVYPSSEAEDAAAGINDDALREEVVKQLHEMASLRAENARMSDRLISAGFGPISMPQAQPSSPSGSTVGSPRSRRRAMEPVREGSPLGQSALWHKPGRIPTTMKDAGMTGQWSPRRLSQHWTSRRSKPRRSAAYI
ncbi:Ankyrin repeat and KH domain-containing protein 1 [Symbiodinium microadriaticum]|uniref:Ankyrin repeat and KH domain-containing protein 1 n=1 Tax=Symbiodinium microadriaticum TaxID=2951 RepID=A0A1Q9C6X9_SYMMI|nr:Ankyrin repeat and KH domain-containing protein 1 [Symbiodinium microadriaticum]